MDLQSALTEAARLLLRTGEHVRVELDPHGTEENHGQDVRIRCEFRGKRLSGLAWDSSVHRAFLRALLELGEEILKVQWDLPSRSGMAAGLFSETAWMRARGELVERDAFFHHYRQSIPPRMIGKPDELAEDQALFELESADPEIRVAMMVDLPKLREGRFLHFATASSNDLGTAILRAQREFVSLGRYLECNFQLQMERSESRQECERNPTLLHLRACADPRNITRFLNLISGTGNEPQARHSADLNWEKTTYDSPVRGFRFLRADSPNLQKIEFGVPEKNRGPALYHPFW